MPPVRICAHCETLLTEASQEIRRHAGVMHTALDWVRRGDTDKGRHEEFVAMLLESFNQSQSAWDAYREHLIQHGLILPSK